MINDANIQTLQVLTNDVCNLFYILTNIVCMKWFLIITYFVCGFIFSSLTFREGFSADIYAIVIAILTLLVTILIGWQIYNAIEVNKKLNEIHRIASKAAYEENKKYNHTTIAVIHYMNALDFYKRQNFTDKAVDELFCCIEEALKGRFQFPIDMAINYLLEIPDDNLFIIDSKRRGYLRTLYRINYMNIDIVITKIEKAHGC